MQIMTRVGWWELVPPAIPAGRTPSLLEAQGLTPPSIVDQYCNAIRDFIAGSINEQTMLAIMTRRNVE